MENNFASIIGKSKSILIVLPTKPYYDQVAGGLSLYLSLKVKKAVQIFSPTPMTVEFNRLVGVNEIAHEIGNRNMLIKLNDYNADDVEKVSWDIENGKFQLSIIPKNDANPPRRDQLEINYAGVSVDTIIIVGGANESHFPILSNKELMGANLIHIGTKQISLSNDKNYLSFNRPASSISEIIYALLADGKLPMNPDIATNLISGIEESSDNFSGEGVSAETFYTIADLIQYGGVRGSNKPSIRGNFPPGSIPGQVPEVNIKNIENKETAQSSSQKAPKDWYEPKVYKGDTPIN